MVMLVNNDFWWMVNIFSGCWLFTWRVVGVGSAEARCALCLGRRGGQGSRAGPPSAPACLSIPSTTPPHSTTHTFNPQGEQSNHHRKSFFCHFQQKVDSHVPWVGPPLQFKQPGLKWIPSLISRCPPPLRRPCLNFCRLYYSLSSNLLNESKGPRDIENLCDQDQDPSLVWSFQIF